MLLTQCSIVVGCFFGTPCFSYAETMNEKAPAGAGLCQRIIYIGNRRRARQSVWVLVGCVKSNKVFHENTPSTTTKCNPPPGKVDSSSLLVRRTLSQPAARSALPSMASSPRPWRPRASAPSPGMCRSRAGASCIHRMKTRLHIRCNAGAGLCM